MNFIIWVLFPSIVVGLIICQFKEKIWQVFALLGCIALTIFIGTTAQLYWQKSPPSFKNMWDTATGVFTFFGVLLTAGAAFATVAAAISYFSINQKLKEAKDSLNEFEKLNQKRTQLEQELETLKAYQSVVQDLQQHDTANIDEEMLQKSLQAARQILDNPQAGFEARLKARAIIQEFDISKKFKQLEVNKSEVIWQQIIAIRQESLAVWKLLFQAASKADSAYEKAQNNYVISFLNYGNALLYYGSYLQDINKENPSISIKDKAIEQFQMAIEQYQYAWEQNSNLYYIVNNWGLALAHQAEIKIEENSCDLYQIKKLWEQAGEKYIEALYLEPQKDTADNWLFVLEDEAAYLSDTGQIQLWQNAKSQVLKLQNHSPEHQQSKVIQDLLNDIANATVIQFPQQEPTP